MKQGFGDERILYLDCSSGISGDMLVAALLDLGADERGLLDTLATLPLDGYAVKVSRVKKAGIDVCDFNVILDDEHDNHDHDMAYLHGYGQVRGSDRQSEQRSEHQAAGVWQPKQEILYNHHDHHGHHEDHDHLARHEHYDEHSHYHEDHYDDHHHNGHNHHDHHGRNLDDIRAILYAGSLNDRALALALRIFEIVAEAEAKVHGSTPDQVHFHEVGAVDSIIDIAAIAYCVDDLQIERVVIPALHEGTGMIRCQHGLLPIPVPATSAIASAYELPLHILPIEGELVTPTGAAAAAALRTDSVLPASFTIQKIGMGAGKREYAVAGILRAMLLQETHSAKVSRPGDPALDFAGQDHIGLGSVGPISGADRNRGGEPLEEMEENNPDNTHDHILKLEANLDDCAGEALGFVMEELFAAGALDVFYIPIYMKKNRPAVMLSVLCHEPEREEMETIIFRHSTCIGIRCVPMKRSKLERESRTVATPLGEAKVKFCFFKGEVYCYPEHESTAKLARESGLGYQEVYHLVRDFGLREMAGEQDAD